MKKKKPKKYFTRKQIADRWECSTRHVDRQIDSGDLIATRLGRLVRVTEADLLDCEHRNRD